MTDWFMADPHFFHGGVLKYCDRPWDNVKDMNAGLIENINSCVKVKDRLFIVGDFAFAGISGTKLIVDQINCKTLILIKGNHDMPAHKMLKAGFSHVFENHMIKIGNQQPILLSHFPYYPDWKQWIRNWWSGDKKIDKRYLHKRIVDRGYFLLHGHTHSKIKILGKQIHVGVDAWNCKPVSQKQILELMRKKK